MSPTHICKIINRCLKNLLRPAYRKHTLYLTILFHFLSYNVWLHFSPSPLLTCLKTLRPQTHADTLGEKHKVEEKLANSLIQTSRETFNLSHVFCLFPAAITWLWRIWNIQKKKRKKYLILYFYINVFVKHTKLIKLHTSKGKRTAREPCIITHSRPFISCAEYNYHLIIGGPIFPRLNRKSIRCARGSACQSVKLEEAEFGGVREKLDAVHCETQLTQEFTVGLIKQMKSRTQKQQA